MVLVEGDRITGLETRRAEHLLDLVVRRAILNINKSKHTGITDNSSKRFLNRTTNLCLEFLGQCDDSTFSLVG
jgi:hypothetical protein